MKEIFDSDAKLPDMVENRKAISEDRKAYTFLGREMKYRCKCDKMHLLVPCLGIDEIVMDGTSKEALQRGPGLFGCSYMPGEGDRNVSIGAFRYGRSHYENLFHNLHRIEKGDYLYLTYQGYVYCYCYKETVIIKPDEASALGMQGYSCLSLISCHPIGQGEERIVVRAQLMQISVQTKEYRYFNNAKE